MDNKALMKIIHANDKEKNVLEGFINKFGYQALISFLEIGLPIPVLNQKTRQSIYLVDRVLNNTPDALGCLSKVTEIPLKSLLFFRNSKVDVKDILEHPEKFDLDTRQSYAFRCMNQVYNSYQEDLKREELQQMREDRDYEIDR